MTYSEHLETLDKQWLMREYMELDNQRCMQWEISEKEILEVREKIWMVLCYIELHGITEEYNKRLSVLNENPTDHEYWNKKAVLDSQYKILVRKTRFIFWQKVSDILK